METKKESAAPKGGKKEGKVTNQFNFCERASQTFNNAVRVRGQGAARRLDVFSFPSALFSLVLPQLRVMREF